MGLNLNGVVIQSPDPLIWGIAANQNLRISKLDTL